MEYRSLVATSYVVTACWYLLPDSIFVQMTSSCEWPQLKTRAILYAASFQEWFPDQGSYIALFLQWKRTYRSTKISCRNFTFAISCYFEPLLKLSSSLALKARRQAISSGKFQTDVLLKVDFVSFPSSPFRLSHAAKHCCHNKVITVCLISTWNLQTISHQR